MSSALAWEVPPPAFSPRRGRGKRRSTELIAAVTLSLAVHLALGVYVWTSKFEPRYRAYSDDVTEVMIVRPVPPPPPPPPPPPDLPKNQPPPPKIQPRPPALVPEVGAIPPLPVPPVVQRIERPEPPAAAPPTPPPPAPPPEPARPSVITNPDWLRKPSGADIARYYPDRAQRMGVEGRAILSCTVDARGRLAECVVVSEAPGDQEFGSAALKMSRQFTMRPMTRDGVPTAGGTVKIPIRFALAEGAG